MPRRLCELLDYNGTIIHHYRLCAALERIRVNMVALLIIRHNVQDHMRQQYVKE